MSSLHAQSLQQTYAEIADGYAQKHGTDVSDALLNKFIQDLPKGAPVLDLGGAVGRDSEWFLDHGFEVTLLDLSPDLLAIAKQRVPQAKIIQGDMTEMRFPEESFAGVWCNAVLLHLTPEEILRVCSTVYKILKPNGIFFCSVKEGKGEEVVASDKYGKPMQRFFSFHTKEDIEKYLTSAGFHISLSETVFDEGQTWVHAFARKV